MDFNNDPKHQSSPDTTENTNDMANVKEHQKSSRKSSLRGIVSMITAGVVGSAITLTVLPHTNYFNSVSNGENEAAVEVTTAPAVKAVSTQSSAATGTVSIADTVEKVSKTIVGVVNYQQQNQNTNSNDLFGNNGNFASGNDSGCSSQQVEYGTGSGIIFQKNANAAYIVTNNHVVEGATKLEISLYNSYKTTAQVVGTDALMDLAVLKIDPKYVTNTAVFGDSSILRPGDQVYAIGNPLGLDLSRTVTQGIVSATNRSIAVNTSAGDWDTNVIQTDAAINPGNSGGALINTQGQVIGINSEKISESGVEGLGFAIPSNDFIPIVNQLIKYGKVERPFLGVGLADLSQVPQSYLAGLPNNIQKGVMITQVQKQSTAANSGLKQQDVIVSMNGTSIGSSTDLREYLYTKVKMGDIVKFGVYRTGKFMNINVTITSQTAN